MNIQCAIYCAVDLLLHATNCTSNPLEIVQINKTKSKVYVQLIHNMSRRCTACTYDSGPICHRLYTKFHQLTAGL